MVLLAQSHHHNLIVRFKGNNRRQFSIRIRVLLNMIKSIVLLLSLFFPAPVFGTFAADDAAYVFQYCTCTELLLFTPGTTPTPQCVREVRSFLKSVRWGSNRINNLLLDSKSECENSCENLVVAEIVTTGDSDADAATDLGDRTSPTSTPSAAPTQHADMSDILSHCDCEEYHGCGNEGWDACLSSRGETLSQAGLSVAYINQLISDAETYCSESESDACSSGGGEGESGGSGGGE